MKRLAICQVTHPGSLESLALMLGAVGWTCALPDSHLRDALVKVGCDTVVDVDGVAKGWKGSLKVSLLTATVAHMSDPSAVYIDIKAHRNGAKVWTRWPELQKRTLWYRINGAEPCNVPGKGDELNPGCPVLTPDLWYRNDMRDKAHCPVSGETLESSYACWPPFLRWSMYAGIQRPTEAKDYTSPVCLIHNLKGWGYGEIGDELRQRIGLRCYGGGSPDGLTPFSETDGLLKSALCMVHLKSQDAPGYALYEALSSGCPVVLPRRMIHRCRMEELFEDGKTCFVFDHPTKLPLDTAACVTEVEDAVNQLKDSVINRQIGEAGRQRLKEIMWSPLDEGDVKSLKDFLGRCFP